MVSTAAEAADVDLADKSVVMYDLLAAHLVHSQRGLTVATVQADFTDDGYTGLSVADQQRRLACDTSLARPLPAGMGFSPLVSLTLSWQPGELELFLDNVVQRLIRGGQRCP